MHAPPAVYYKLNGFNRFICKSQYLKSFVIPGLHPGKILGTQVTTKNKLIVGGGGDMRLQQMILQVWDICGSIP